MSAHRNIKEFKPSKHSRFKQGYIDPNSCQKLFESQKGKPIIYRSSWERQFVQWLEKSPHVLRWGSECLSITYFDPTSDTYHHYYPDYVVETDKGRIIVEVKPYHQTQQPDPSYPPDSWTVKTYIKNIAKWKAAIEFCKKHDMTFKIVTERTISKL